jgi:hypothetical protein
MQEKYCFVVSPNIESATCVLLFKWLSQKENVSIVVSTENNLANDLTRLNLEPFKFIYIVGFYNLKNIPSTLDRKNVYIINKKILDKPSFENAHFLTGSNTTLELFNDYFRKFIKDALTNNQEIFIDNIKKYLTYNFDDDLTPLKLFYYFKTQPDQNKVDSFVRRFNSGIILFNESENYKINLLLKELAITLKNLKLFAGKLKYNNKTYTTVATFTTKFKNESAHKILKKGFDIAIVIDLEKKTVHFRKGKNAEVDLGQLVNKSFSGYGTEFAAFCNVNEAILELTKNFFPVNEHQRT